MTNEAPIRPDCIEAEILANANDLIIVLDPRGVIHLWNRTAETITGYPSEEVIGKRDIWKRLYPDAAYRERVTKEITGIIAARKYFRNVETTIVTKNGEQRIISWNTRQIESNGTIWEIAIGRDITELVAAKQVIQRNEAFQKSIIANAKLWMMFLDPDNNVRIWNKAAVEISGYNQEEVLGNRRIWQWIYPEDNYRKEITKKIVDIIRNKKYLENFETNVRTKHGEIRRISWNTRELTGIDGKLQGFIVVGNDITEKKRAEEALIAYMAEIAMRIKQPVEIVRDTLREVAQLCRDNKLSMDEIAIMLDGQVRNATQIAANVQEFQKAITDNTREIPEAYRKFFEGE